MIEVLGALAVASVATVGMMGVSMMALDDAKGQQTATYHAELHKGVANWMSVAANRQAVIGTASTTTPHKITLASLAAHLPAGFGATNPYQQTPCVLAYYDSATSRIEVAVTSEGGTAIKDGDLGYIVAHAGTGAGAIYESAPTIARGAFGGWQVTASTYTSAAAANRCGATQANAGHLLALLPFDETGLYSLTGAGEWLARNAIPGRPELNRMNTELDMGDNRIVGLQDLYDTTATACVAGIEGRDGLTATGQPRRCLSGAWVAVACSIGDLSVGPTGKVLSCQGGLWKEQGGSAYWGDPVADFASLPACSATNNGETRVARDATDGAARPRAYSCNGTVWAPLALDQNGNLDIPGTASIGALNGNLQVIATAAEGAACTGDGRIARSTTSSGLILSCQSGVWKTQGGSNPGGGYRVWRTSGGCVSANPRTGACSCPAGTTAFFVGMGYQNNPWDWLGMVCN